MKNCHQSVIALALAGLAGLVQAQSTAANAQRCQDLSNDVKATYNAALKARVPKEDPGTFVQNGYDIKGLMSTDVTSGFSKLLGGDFSRLMNSLVAKGVQNSVERGAQNFSGRVNNILAGAGVVPSTFSSVSNWGSSASNVSTPGLVPANSFAPVTQPEAPAPARKASPPPAPRYSNPYLRPFKTGN